MIRSVLNRNALFLSSFSPTHVSVHATDSVSCEEFAVGLASFSSSSGEDSRLVERLLGDDTLEAKFNARGLFEDIAACSAWCHRCKQSYKQLIENSEDSFANFFRDVERTVCCVVRRAQTQQSQLRFLLRDTEVTRTSPVSNTLVALCVDNEPFSEPWRSNDDETAV
jgi:hypothetical protein